MNNLNDWTDWELKYLVLSNIKYQLDGDLNVVGRFIQFSKSTGLIYISVLQLQ